MTYLLVHLVFSRPFVALFQENGIPFRVEIPLETPLSQVFLSSVHELLLKAGIQKEEIKGIFVCKGPGGFTTTRVGIAFANTFGYVYRIPVIDFEDRQESVDVLISRLSKRINEKDHFQPVQPYYDRAPHVTQPKS